MTKAKNNNSLSSFDEGPFDEDWTFLWKDNYEPISRKCWLSEMLFYEIVREFEEGAQYSGDPRDYLNRISDGLFPNTPFLKIPEETQKEIVEELRKPGSLFRQIKDLSSQPVFEWSAERRLTDEAEDHLINIAMEASDAEAAKWDGLHGSDFRQGTNPGERAACAERNKMIRKGEAILDESRCVVTLHLDLAFKDHQIEKKFKGILEQLRNENTPHSSEHETRGKNRDTGLQLRELAAWRMRYRFGSFDKIGDMLTVDRADKNFPDLPYANVSGWNKAVNRGAALIARFKEWYPCRPA